jgi:pyrroloquinoline quinone biosynthesis protein E
VDIVLQGRLAEVQARGRENRKVLRSDGNSLRLSSETGCVGSENGSKRAHPTFVWDGSSLG